MSLHWFFWMLSNVDYLKQTITKLRIQVGELYFQNFFQEDCRLAVPLQDDFTAGVFSTQRSSSTICAEQMVSSPSASGDNGVSGETAL